MTPTLVFDIETVPDVAGLRRLNRLPATLPDAEVALEIESARRGALDVHVATVDLDRVTDRDVGAPERARARRDDAVATCGHVHGVQVAPRNAVPRDDEEIEPRLVQPSRLDGRRAAEPMPGRGRLSRARPRRLDGWTRGSWCLVGGLANIVADRARS